MVKMIYQNILEGGGGISKSAKRMSMPAVPSVTKPQPLVAQKKCFGCSKQIHQSRVFAEPGKPSIIYCEKCYVDKFAKGNCPTCFKPVMSKTDPYITHNKQTWHSACFRCFKCSIDVSTKPMVDLRGRPCCEECLMAQSGAENRPTQESETTLKDSSTPANRSLTSSPAPSPSSQYRNSRISNNNHIDVQPELSARLQHNLAQLDVTLDNGYIQQQSNSPLSAMSTSSQSSLGASFRQTPSSGYTSGTSSTYSSLGRKRSGSHSPSVIPSATGASMLRPDQNSFNGSPLLSYRPSSALSIHSYASSRTNSPAPNHHENESDNIFKEGSDYPDNIDRDHDGIVENTSESTLHGLRRSRSRSLGGFDNVNPTLSRELQRPDNGITRNGSKPEPLKYRSSAESEKYPQSTMMTEPDLVKKTESLSLSSVEREKPRVETQLQQQTSFKPTLGRVRSRSTVGTAPISSSVRARTEAYMNQAQPNSPPTPKSASQIFNANRASGVFNSSTLPSKQPTIERETNESKPIQEEPEPNRSMYRHGRQRSNTVGEAISFPAVSVADTALSPSQMRKAIIPENSCLKCLEKVTENGVKLQNGDRYHIGCFLCHGCKQVFTESEFHIVLGRPYHPGCVSMAAPSSNMGVITKCHHCHKVISNKSIRFAGMNYHPQCFTCSHCSKVLTSTSKFFEVDGQVECEQCCNERDTVRLAPKMVPVPRATDHFPMPAMVIATVDNNGRLDPSGPGMMATSTNNISVHDNLSRSGSITGNGSPTSDASSPTLRSPGSPTSYPSASDLNSGSTSPVLVVTSPIAQRTTPPTLTSFFGTRTRPLPKFGGVTSCPRCQQPVGVMDQVPGPKNEKWHKKCLNCRDCKKVLDSSALTRGEGEAFCRGCFEIMSNTNSSIPNVGVDPQNTSNTTTSRSNTNFNPNSNTIAIIKQEQPQPEPQLLQTNASLANERQPSALVQPTHNNNDNSISSTIPSTASSAIPFANTIAPAPTSASFLAALVQASNSNQNQVSAAPQQPNNALQTLVEAHAQTQAQHLFPPTGLFPSSAAIPQQPTPTAAPLNISLAAPAISATVQVGNKSAKTESAQPPSQPPQQHQPSASALFLQQQLAAQRASQAQTPTQTQKASASSPQQRQRQQSQSPNASKSTKSANPKPPTATSSTGPSTVIVTGIIPPINSNQIQHDLKQLQLHNQRQASAEAAAAAASTTFGNTVINDGSDANTTINSLLTVNNNTSNDVRPKSEDQPQPSPTTTTSEQTFESVLSTRAAAINNGGDLILASFPGGGGGASVAEGSGTPRLGTPAGSDTTTSVNNDNANETPQIFKATYSGVPVFEMICRGVAVMRRRSDSYLNATQILKVAEFDKPQRTRILEREVQKGEHEKVQGGYGKYQGTWVPYERGVQLCMEYNVLQVLRPLLEYQFSKVNSPPLAPKHVTAASLKPRKPKEPRATGSLRGRKKKKEVDQPQISGAQISTLGVPRVPGVTANGPAHTYGDVDGDVSTSEMDDDETHSRAGSEASMDETMSILSGHSRTPSPIGSRLDLSSSEISDNETFSSSRRRQRSSEKSPRSRKKQHRPGDELFIGYHGKSSSSYQQQQGSHSPRVPHDIEMRARETPPSPSLRQTSPRRRRGPGEPRNTGSWQDEHSSTRATASASNQGRYAETLLEYFVSDSTTLPSILTHPPSDLDFDLIIDEEGHTPLHWAVAMARTKIVKLLVQHGADIYRVNNQGQTALMRSVLFTNNFDMKTFPSLLEILQKTIFTIDKHDQTVFHHVAATAGTRGKVHASRYYMECLLEKLAQHPQELASIINVQDVVGDTALIIATRIGNKKVVRLLLEAGADSKIRNKSGRNADEYIQDAENQSSGPSSSALSSSLHPVQQHISLLPNTVSRAPGSSTSHLHLPHYHSIGPGIPATPQKGPQQIYHHPSGMTPSASSVPFRMLGDASPNLHGHPSPIMQSQSASTMHSMLPAPPSHDSYMMSSSNMDRSQNPGGSVRTSQKMIPAVTELFAHLTQSYEKDLYEKEQDLVEARNLLHSLQTEIKEGSKTIERLRTRTMYLGQAEERVRTLEGMIRHEINLRHRIRLENLVGQEETRLRREQDALHNGQGTSGTTAVGMDHVLKLEKEASELRSNLSNLQQSRKDQVEQIVRLKSQQGKRRHEYKRLIALCCNVSIDEVDDLLGPLLTTLGNEDGI
ncbi:hypothetical protein BGZ76_008874, partial [Entomortierella beljakovae]